MSTEETDRIDIHDPIFDICDRLGLEPNNVRRLYFSPSSVTAEILLVNESGSKYIDQESGEAAHEIRTFKVST